MNTIRFLTSPVPESRQGFSSRHIRIAVTLLCCLTPAAHAAGSAPANSAASRVTASKVSGSTPSIQVEARQALLAEALEAVAGETGVRLKHSDLPADTLATVCKGETVETVVECLVGTRANLIYRYAEAKDGKRVPEEIWVKGKVSQPAGAAYAVADPVKKEDGSPAAAGAVKSGLSTPPPASPQATQKALEMAAASDAAQKLEGLSRLAGQGSADDAAVRQTLERALSDEDPSARAQALYGLSRLEGVSTVGMLQDALHDSDVSVRLMAVDSAGTDAQGAALLQQALGDADETVREFAAMRLREHAAGAAAQ
ncbi:HEAT repeat domain-containing protein [Methylolobus aquaticus]